MLVLCLILLTQGRPVRTNPLQTLTNYLTILTERGCQGEVIHLTCETGNKLSIQSVFSGSGAESESCHGVSASSQCGAREERGEVRGEVQRLCQGRDQCHLNISSSLLTQAQPPQCAGGRQRKYLEVNYQCRPARFRSRTMCRDDSDSLSCPENNQGLVILSASFLSVNTNNNYFYCPGLVNTQHSDSELAECTESELTPEIVQLCHSHQNCSIKASPVSLGSPACQELNVFLKVIYACVTRGNIRTVNKNFNSNQRQAGTEADFTTMRLNIQTSTAPATTFVNKEIIEAVIEQEEENEGEDMIEMETRITDKKLIFSSELKLEPQSDVQAPDRPGDLPGDSRESEEHNFQDPKFLTILITSAVSVVTITLGLAIILSLTCRKRAGTSDTSSVSQCRPALTNLDTVSLESQEEVTPDTKNVTFTTFQNILPSSSSSQTTETSTTSSQLYLETIKTLDQKYSLSPVSSTPNASKIMQERRKENLQTFSQTTLLESASECDSELRRMSGDWRDQRLPSASDSLGEERLQHSFDHFSHEDFPSPSPCQCSSSSCHRNQNNLTVLI